MTFAIVFLFSLFAFFVGLKYIKYRRRKWEEHVAHVRTFHGLARKLINDKHINDRVLKYVQNMNALINDSSVAYRLVVLLRMEGDNFEKAESAENMRDRYVSSPSINEADKLRVLLHLEELVGVWVSAVAALSPIFGVRLKAEWADGFSKPEKMKSAVYKASHDKSRAHWFVPAFKFS